MKTGQLVGLAALVLAILSLVAAWPYPLLTIAVILLAALQI